MKLKLLSLVLLIATGCSQSSHTESTGSPGQTRSQDQNPSGQQQNTNTVQTLKIYDGSSNSLNKFQAVNVDPGKLFFDFDYSPDRDEALALNFESIKSTLLGCADSDIGFEFNLYQKTSDGNIDLSTYEQLGPSPIAVTKGTPYVLRANLSVRKSCLGIAYSFKVEASN